MDDTAKRAGQQGPSTRWPGPLKKSGVRFGLLLVALFLIVAWVTSFVASQLWPRAHAPATLTLNQQIALYERSIIADPSNPQYRVELGKLYWQVGRLDEARKEFAKALELAPQSAELRVDLGVLYWHSGQKEEGLKYLDDALQLDPKLAEAHLFKGMLLAKWPGREPEAISELQQVLGLSQDPGMRDQVQQLLKTLQSQTESRKVSLAQNISSPFALLDHLPVLTTSLPAPIRGTISFCMVILYFFTAAGEFREEGPQSRRGFLTYFLSISTGDGQGENSVHVSPEKVS